MRLKLAGDGTWTRWDGTFTGKQGDTLLADLRIANRSGRYSVVGPVHPAGYLSGIAARALGASPAVSLVGELKNSVATGAVALRGSGVQLDAKGAIDFAANAFDGVTLSAAVLDPALLGKDTRLQDARLTAQLDGPFRTLVVPHELTVAQADISGTVLTDISQRGTLRFVDGQAVLPLDASVARIVSGNRMIDPRLVGGTLRGQITLDGSALRSDDLRLVFPGLDARLTLRGDTARGGYALAGPVEAARARAGQHRHDRCRGEGPVQDRQRRAVDAGGELHRAADARSAMPRWPTWRARISASTAG